VTNPRNNTKAPTVIEIKKALKELKRGKAAGVEDIPPEVLKVDLDITANMLHPLFEKIWNEGEMPNDCKCGLIIKIPKKRTPQTVIIDGVWKVAKTKTSKVQVFVNRCLRKILNIHWPKVISNEEIYRRAEETEIYIKIRDGNGIR
jgi:hypothetical protein